MTEEEIRKIINDTFDENIMNNLDSSIIFKYIEGLEKENQKYKEVIDKAIEYINEYAWQEDIIGDMFTVTGKPMIDKYMQLDWDNCNELLDILKGVE